MKEQKLAMQRLEFVQFAEIDWATFTIYSLSVGTMEDTMILLLADVLPASAGSIPTVMVRDRTAADDFGQFELDSTPLV